MKWQVLSLAEIRLTRARAFKGFPRGLRPISGQPIDQ